MVKISLFSQVIQLLPQQLTSECALKHGTDYCCKKIDSRTHLITMLYAQLAQINTLRDINIGMRSLGGNLSHLGVQNVPSKSAISYVNIHRKSDYFMDVYYKLYHKYARDFPRGPRLRKIKKIVRIADSSVIPLSLAAFDWARFRRAKGAVKLHLVLDYDGLMPCFATLTEGLTTDIEILSKIEQPPGSILIFDRGYLNLNWFQLLDSRNISFVTRAKGNLQYKVIENRPVDSKAIEGFSLESDQIILLTGPKSKFRFPKKLRLVKVRETSGQEREFVFLTNNLSWTAPTVAELYRERWHIETFFKLLKQNLRVKSFVGTTPNAVLIQVWCALISMLLLAWLKAKSQFKWQFSNLAVFLRLHLAVKMDLWQWLNEPFKPPEEEKSGQLRLFD